MTIVLCALFVIIYEIFANQIKCQKVDLENDGQGQGTEKPGLAPFYCQPLIILVIFSDVFAIQI